MIGLDTNILIRYLTRDDKVQTPLADRLIEGTCTPERPGWISLVVLCETAWVLRQSFGYDRAAIGAVVEMILCVAQLRVERSDAVQLALARYRQNRADLADCLIGLLNEESGCETTYTFDRGAAALPGFTTF